MESEPDRRASSETVLVLNAGSSSLKYGLFDAQGATRAEGNIKRIGSPECADHAFALDRALLQLRKLPGALESIRAVGHRIVHGGAELWMPTWIDDAALSILTRNAELAPLHNGPALAVILHAEKALPAVPHVAVFDTGFHHDLPLAARSYAIPFELAERWSIRRYGFHGISCEYLTARIVELEIIPARRVILCHLGAGASMTAVYEGRSVETTMGFTPLEGLVMATRSGDLDPGLIVFLMRHAGMGADEIERLLDRQSGWGGMSGLTSDFADLEKLAREGNTRARDAIDLFTHRVRKALGSSWATLGGVDLIVFSAGIGENSATAREQILGPMSGVGWTLDPEANRTGAAERRISPPGVTPQIWVIPTHEEVQIARHVRRMI